jgi:transcription-repair coupling factor (superfamily II helicase)
MYKRISSAQLNEDLDILRQELVDRYGKFGEPVENLFRYARLRQTALSLRIQGIERKGDQVYIRLAENSDVNPEKLLRMLTRNRRAAFSPQGLLSLAVPDQPPEMLFQLLHRTIEDIRT